MGSITSRVYFFVIIFIFSLSLGAQNPATEIRAAWLTTNWNLDWPSPGQSIENQKKELCQILDKLHQANFNTILFQTRIRGDVFYRSQIEPLSPFFQKNIRTGSSVPYDPLSFVIQECHKRGMECHAWFVTFPVGSKKQVAAQGQTSIVKRQPQICKLHNDEWYLDPGNPQTRQYISSLVKEIITNYDVDGIHFDYIRYPENAKKFPDTDTYRKYGYGKNIQEWRRENINSLVADIYRLVKKQKPWVQVSSSPLGRYKNLDYFGRGTWTAYESVHQDAGQWMKDGIMDALYPMMYYNESTFHLYVNDWLKNSNGRFVVPGLGAYRLDRTEGDWMIRDITDQIDSTRSVDATGQAFYRVGNVLNNTKGILNTLQRYYEYPAKIPPMKWLDNIAPNSPINMQVYRDTNGYIAIEWDSSDNTEQQTYTVYESVSGSFDTQNAKSIVMTGIRSNKIYLSTDDEERGVYYSITASDRFHNESVPCFPTYFILSTKLEK